MQLPDDLGQLTYCLNIHPTQTWDAVRTALLGPVRAVKAAQSPDAPFGVGLRLSAQALEELRAPDARAELKEILVREDFRVVTMNGFPFGPFHGIPVKQNVYQPDWKQRARLDYTCWLADLMSELGSAGETLSLSTVPGTYKPLARGNEAEMADNLLKAVAHCIDLRARTQVTIALALEPEPYCFLETIAESVAFFREHLFSPAAAERVSRLTGLSLDEAREALPRHLGLCYDVCHAAVEFEDPATSLAMLREANIPIHKLQLSAALRVPHIDAAHREALQPFCERTYLHQVVAKAEDGLVRYADLPEALADDSRKDGEEWRVHFHVPIFVDTVEPFQTTQPFLREILALHRERPISSHLEVETYTWQVLPETLRRESVVTAIGRELTWVKSQLA
ncbi:metabolite traffic protein EboE [Salinicola rhizosphaerae]|uniref:Sugar phosphate isomerase n=1 Tax=Salinicola rhizosphaerae TaxID=1443141 RepID=A0ABQ3E777_9GAMM|nr:metabolite traffic protein EboE [Salinicola rhizosphaerae]GHB25611.1 sugar phosphate isomerase [Salinicola rhizosphaerae]